MSFLFYVGAAKGHLRLLSIPVTYYPAILVFVIVFIMVFPFNLLYRRARFGLFILFFQTLATPFVSCHRCLYMSRANCSTGHSAL